MEEEPRLRLFGVARWCSAGRRFDLPDALPGYLLAYLAYRGDWIARDALLALFWPDRRDSEAMRNLRANLHRLRALLGGWSIDDALQAQARRVRVALPTDVACFREAIGRGEWAAAVAWQPAPLLAQLSFRGFPLLDEWARGERAALADAWRNAALRAALAHESAGRAADAAALLTALLRSADCGPTEDAVQALLRVAVAAGARDVALREYERLVRALRDETGLPPLRETVELAARLRRPAQAVHGASPAAAAVVPRTLQRPPRLVGRDVERALAADLARPIVVVVGEPGVGKTRLLEDALPHASWIACREGLEQVPLAPLAEWIDDQRDSLPGLAAQRRDLARLVPSLLDGEEAPPADPATAKPRLLAAIARLFDGRPAVFDDVQWADASTRELIVLLARRGVPLRLAYRSSELRDELRALLDALAAAGELQRIELAPLDEARLRELLGAMSGSAPPLFGGWLYRHTGGNPFFAVQTLRALFDSGQLELRDGGWASALDEITRDYSELQIAPRVADLVARRLRGLSDAARRVLDVIAVAGDARAVEPIAAAAGLSAWTCAEAIGELQAAGLLRERRFAHDLVRQSVQRALPDALRGLLHAGVARHFAGRLRDEAIAEHWWLAGDAARSLDAALRAAATQREAGLHDEALALTARALDRAADGAGRARLHAARSRIRLEQGDLDGAQAEADAALGEAAAPGTRADALLVVAALRMQQGRLDAARDAIEQAAECDGDHQGLPVARARVALLLGRAADALPELERCCARLRRRPPGAELVRALSSLGAAFDELGEPARGLPLHREAYRLAARLNARYAQVEVAVNLLWSLQALGRNDEAVALAGEALALGEYDSSATLRNNLAWSLRRLGRIDAAIALDERTVAGDDPTLALIARARLVEMRAGAGRRAEIDRLIDAFDSTDVYLAHAAAAKAVLLHGDRAQVERVLPRLKAQPIDPVLQRELAAALVAHGIDPAPYVGAVDPH